MPHCTQCGCSNDADARFCRQCGRPLQVPSAEPVAATQPDIVLDAPPLAPATPPVPTASAAATPSATGGASNQRVAWIAGLAVLVLAPLGIWLATRPPGNAPTTAGPATSPAVQSGAAPTTSTATAPMPPGPASTPVAAAPEPIPVPIGATTMPVPVTNPTAPAFAPPAPAAPTPTPQQQHVVVLSDPKGKKPAKTAVPTPLGGPMATPAPTPPPPQPQAAPVASPPPVPAPTPRPAPPPGPASPREACGARVFLAMQACIQDLCKTPRWARHAQCAELRDIQKLREERIRQGND